VKIKKELLIKVAVLVVYLTMIAVNTLANILPIGGITTGEISNFYPNLFAPAAYTFAIWGLIYLLLAGYVLYQFGLFQKKKSKKKEKNFSKKSHHISYILQLQIHCGYLLGITN